jgi:tRNA A-37 threonylcarbamoyl transferase component Bud32
VRYYVKRYRKAGKGLRKYFGKPRIQNEWLNLQHFAEWGIPTAPLVAYGMQRSCGRFIRGAMITEEIVGTLTLEELAERDDARLEDRAWVNQTSQKLADIARTLHKNRFAHNDLKWRNILVDNQNKLYLIDCPLGNFWHGAFLKHRMRKDISNLDRIAQYKLSRTQRLHFYLQYAEKKHLTEGDKKLLRHLLIHPSGRVSSFSKHRVK